jgi:hypothetical protein
MNSYPNIFCAICMDKIEMFSDICYVLSLLKYVVYFDLKATINMQYIILLLNAKPQSPK